MKLKITYRRVTSGKLVYTEVSTARPIRRRFAGYSGLRLMINVYISLNTFQACGLSDRCSRQNWESVPISLYFKLVVAPDQPNNHGAEIESHIQRKSDIGSTKRFADEKVRGQTRSKRCSKQVNSDPNPAIEIERCPRHFE